MNFQGISKITCKAFQSLQNNSSKLKSKFKRLPLTKNESPLTTATFRSRNSIKHFKFNMKSKIDLISKTTAPAVAFCGAAVSGAGVRMALTPVKVEHMSYEKDDNTFEPDDPRLRTSECLRNAALLSVESTAAVLSQTVYAIINVEKEYQELIKMMTMLTENALQALGNKYEEEKIADVVLEGRQQLAKVKTRRQDLDMLFASADKMVDAAAEVAFTTGSEFASTSAGERLYKAQEEVKRVKAKSADLEMELNTAGVKMIEAMALFEEKQKRKDDGNKEEDKIKMELEKMNKLEEGRFTDGDEIDNQTDRKSYINSNSKDDIDIPMISSNEEQENDKTCKPLNNTTEEEDEECKPIVTSKEEVFSEDESDSKEDKFVFIDTSDSKEEYFKFRNSS